LKRKKVKTVDNEGNIRLKSLARLAKIFNLSKIELTEDMVFATDLKPSNVSSWKRNEYDIILDDIRDASNRELLKKIDRGELEIITVADYINHMINCFSDKPELFDLSLDEIC
jgi:hypothetical protein